MKNYLEQENFYSFQFHFRFTSKSLYQYKNKIFNHKNFYVSRNNININQDIIMFYQTLFFSIFSN